MGCASFLGTLRATHGGAVNDSRVVPRLLFGCDGFSGADRDVGELGGQPRHPHHRRGHDSDVPLPESAGRFGDDRGAVAARLGALVRIPWGRHAAVLATSTITEEISCQYGLDGAGGGTGRLGAVQLRQRQAMRRWLTQVQSSGARWPHRSQKLTSGFLRRCGLGCQRGGRAQRTHVCRG